MTRNTGIRYRAVQRACGEEGLRAETEATGTGEGGVDAESYLGDADPSLYDSPCFLSLCDDAMLRLVGMSLSSLSCVVMMMMMKMIIL